MAQMEVLGDVVLRAVAEALGQPPGHFDEVMAPRPEIRVKVIRYPSPTPSDDASLQGVGAHRDNGLLTLLHQDGVGGLEIEHDGRFVAVPAVPGAYVLNIGEMLQLVSQGYLRATVHRVVSPPRGRERISVAFFHNPRLDATLRPLRLPPQLATDAPGGASTDPANPILARYGENALKVRLRSHPNVTARHHADLLDAPPCASVPARAATSAASVPAG
jgi:isopenicillin N synthase-like dioxygenase